MTSGIRSMLLETTDADWLEENKINMASLYYTHNVKLNEF